MGSMRSARNGCEPDHLHVQELEAGVGERRARGANQGRVPFRGYAEADRIEAAVGRGVNGLERPELGDDAGSQGDSIHVSVRMCVKARRRYCRIMKADDRRQQLHSMTEPNFRPAGAADLEEGRMRPVQIEGRDLVLCRTKDGWHALDDVCTHAWARMSEGRLRGFRLICPLHGASFDCRTGSALGPPAVQPLKTYPVRIVGDRVEIAL
jgi:nitrite reductase/ring-hydroxylating ferredoxin subunit